MARRVFITVGEPSGDIHAGRLIRALRTLDPDVVCEGLGGPQMAAAGATVLYDSVSRASYGWRFVLRYFEMLRMLRFTRKYFQQHRPDLQICIDSWSANNHWARLAHDMNVPVIYYIAPQVWASRPGRIKRLARYVDRVACILPFEEEYFRQRGIEATFVGHPLFDDAPRQADSAAEARFPRRAPVIGLIPGSRSSVARENFPNLLDVSDRILQEFPEARFVVPTLSTTNEVVQRLLVERETARQKASDDGAAAAKGPPVVTVSNGLSRIGPFTFGINRFDELVRQCDLCLTVSGTATLHVASNGVPLIVVYRLNPIIWHLVARWVVKTRTYSLVNLLNDNRQQIVPEFIPWYGSNEPVAGKALEYLRNPSLLEEQRERLQKLIGALNRPGASRNVANLALDLLAARAETLPGKVVPQVAAVGAPEPLHGRIKSWLLALLFVAQSIIRFRGSGR